jgi:uncharacterized repeat protein (TIGR01451 family)
MHFFVCTSTFYKLHFCIIKKEQSDCLIIRLMRKYLFIFLFLLTAGFVSAQGWERLYGGGGFDIANAVAKTPDGGYVMAGYYGLSRLFIVKVDADGNEQWAKNYTGSGSFSANAVISSRDTGIIAVGYVKTSQKNIYLFKTDAFGKKIWSKSIGATQIGQDEEAFDILELPDGSLIIVGSESQKNDLFVLKTDALGNTIWYKTFGLPSEKEQGYGITLAPNGDLIAVGAKNESLVYAVRVQSNDGSLVWERTYDFYQGLFDIGRDVVFATDDAFVIAGYTNTNGFVAKIDGTGDNLIWIDTIAQTRFNSISTAPNGGYFVAGQKDLSTLDGELCIDHVAENGNMLWESLAGKVGPDAAYGVVPANDGGAVAAGSSSKDLTVSEQRAYLVKTDKNGTVLTSYLRGNIFWDNQVQNCVRDQDEPSLTDWVVKVEGKDDTLYAVSNANGAFQILVDTGYYTISLYRFSDYWETCTPTIVVPVLLPYDTIEVPIPVKTTFTCPRNEVDIATPILRRCADNEYVVRYCNSGTATSDVTFIKVVLDGALTVTQSSIPFIPDADTLLFDVGELEPGVCKEFTFNAFLDCNETVAGQTHCVSAHIYPDTFCNINSWDRSLIVAEGRCDGDSVRFVLKNVGTGDMGSVQEFVIVEDVLFLVQPGNPDFQYQLDAGATKSWASEKDGKTYRIIAKQTPGYPGTSFPTAAVEGCISDTSGNTPSLGFYTMFPEDDQDAFVSINCQESSESDYNPTILKRGHPKGYDVPNYVSPQTDLDYLIHFTNSGNDTVQQVIVRDTLSAALDPATVRPGASSHPYTFQVYGNGIVQFTIPNANLIPGGSAADGFVKFRVAQRDSLPCGTQILNHAAIYFNYNTPILSNTTLHTACQEEEYWILSTVHVDWPGADLNVYPNPFTESAIFEVTGVPSNRFELSLYDTQGRLIANPVFTQPTFRLLRHQIPAGVVFYRLTSQGKSIASGKLIAE